MTIVVLFKKEAKQMRLFENILIIFSLIIGLSFFNAWSSVIDEDDLKKAADFLLNEPIETSDAICITINQIKDHNAGTLSKIQDDARNTFGLSASNEGTVAINLDNSSHKVKVIYFNICDKDNYLTLLRCEKTDRTATDDFLCRSRELENGCCSVSLFSITMAVIEEGSGPILNLTYGVSEEVPSGECRTLNIENAFSTDPVGNSLEVISSPGEFCFSVKSPSCEVTIDPESAEVLLGDTIQFNASTIGTGCNDSCYAWEVVGSSGSIIDNSGLYTAGNIAGTDIVTVIDKCNGDISGNATITLLDSDNEDDVDTIIIDGCDSRVADEVIDDGFTMSELITVCANSTKNHGAFVSCVADLTNEWKKDGLISRREKGAIQRCAAKSNIP